MKPFRFFYRNSYCKPHSWDLSQLDSEHPAYKTYQAVSSASVDTIWQKLIDLADVSWHPLITSTNLPRGLTAKPGLIYSIVPRWFPIPVRIFVERVTPCELMSIRLQLVPGLVERVIYRLESTVVGTQVSYSIVLQGWLSPVAWSVMKPFVARMAGAIAKAAEDTTPQTAKL